MCQYLLQRILSRTSIQVFFNLVFTFLIALTFCKFLQKNDPRSIKVLFCRFWAKENFSTQLKILKPYVALIFHYKGLFSTMHCQFSWRQSNKNSTQFYSQFRNFFPINVLYKIFQIFNQKNHENCLNHENNKDINIYMKMTMSTPWTAKSGPPSMCGRLEDHPC